MTKKHGKVRPQLPPIFPASTVLNVGIAGNPLQSRGNGTNNLSSDSSATISSTITEILFLLPQACSFVRPLFVRLFDLRAAGKRKVIGCYAG